MNLLVKHRKNLLNSTTLMVLSLLAWYNRDSKKLILSANRLGRFPSANNSNYYSSCICNLHSRLIPPQHGPQIPVFPAFNKKRNARLGLLLLLGDARRCYSALCMMAPYQRYCRAILCSRYQNIILYGGGIYHFPENLGDVITGSLYSTGYVIQPVYRYDAYDVFWCEGGNCWIYCTP